MGTLNTMPAATLPLHCLLSEALPTLVRADAAWHAGVRPELYLCSVKLGFMLVILLLINSCEVVKYFPFWLKTDTNNYRSEDFHIYISVSSRKSR